MAEKDAYLAIKNTVEDLEQAPAKSQEIHKLKSLRTGLRTMSMLLKDFDGQEYEPDVAAWLEDVRDVAYKTQEVIDSVAVDSNYQNQKSKLGRLLSGVRVTEHHVGEIENIRKRMKKHIGFQPSPSFKIHDVVGFKDAQETLVRQLIGDAADAKLQRKAILICGKAGSGKTTLAEMVRADNRIEKHFDYRVWVSLTQALLLEELIRRILEHNPPSTLPDSLSKEELKARFCERLKGKRYLVVIDSAQNSDVLDELMSLIPDESNGSRILLASRVPPADLQVQQEFSFSHKIEPLNADQSWQILSRKVLERESYPALEVLGKRMAEKCKGSPRAIVTLAAILNHREKTEEMWSRFEGYNPSNYDDLPKELQFCLLSFGPFPEGDPISAKQMIQIWMAEGLLKKTNSKEAEEIGEDYLNILIEKSFVQIHEKRADKSAKITLSASSRIFCVSKSTAENERKRIVIYNPDTDNQKSLQDCYKSAHYLHCFHSTHSTHSTPSPSVSFWEELQKFDNLRVLNLGFVKLDKVHKVIGKLKNLRYLRLWVPDAKHLPSSIVNLDKLETLDMRESPLISLPHGIWKMQLLRHLYLKGSASLPKASNIDYHRAFPNLQTLSGINSDKILRWLMVRAKFPNVRKLRISSSDPKVTSEFLNSLDLLYHLKSLRVEMHTSLPTDSNAFPSSLTKLTLFKTRLDPSSFKTLEKLPNLRVLKLLKGALSGEEIECSSGGFLQLEVMCIALLLRKWTKGKGSMRCLKNLVIKNCCITLETIPEDLRHAATFTAREEEENQ